MLWKSFSWWKIIIAYETLYYTHTIIHKNNMMASNVDALLSYPLPKESNNINIYTTTTSKVQNSMNLITHTLLVLTMWMQNFHHIGIMRGGFILKSRCGYGRRNREVTTLIQDDCVGICMSRYKSSRAGERLARFPAPRLLQALFYCTQALLSGLFHLTKWGKEPSAIAGISWKSYFLKGTYRLFWVQFTYTNTYSWLSIS